MAETTKPVEVIAVGMNEITAALLKDSGLPVCTECGSQIRTRLNGELFCPKGKGNCAFVKQVKANQGKE